MDPAPKAIEAHTQEESASVMAIHRRNELFEDLAASDAHLARDQSN
jgi:hypothetical protein